MFEGALRVLPPFSLMMLFFLLFSCLTTLVIANTEIRNFGVDDDFSYIGLSTLEKLKFENGHRIEELNATSNERMLNVVPARLWTRLEDVCRNEDIGMCQNEVWMKLALGESEWERYEKFTLRISWPAFVRPLTSSTISFLN